MSASPDDWGVRILIVKVQHYRNGLDRPFAKNSAQALREYADAIDEYESMDDSKLTSLKDSKAARNCKRKLHDRLYRDSFTASNGCEIEMIHGMESMKPRTETDEKYMVSSS